MRTLAIECATEACSVALFEGSALLASDFRLLGRGHAEQLVPMIASLPERGKAERIVVSLGPGSFTGLRVGLAAAKALALAWGAELVGYPTLSLIAAQVLTDRQADGVTVCMTGGHGEWFVQDFGIDGSPATLLASLSPDAAALQGRCTLVAGSQAEALVRQRGNGEAVAVLPDARRFAQLDAAALTADTTLIYGRAPDARPPAEAR